MGSEQEIFEIELRASEPTSLSNRKAMIEGQFQTDGETGKGNMDMSVNAGGMNMKMNMNWTARRTGDC